jgi:hypothetical protein
MKNRLEGMRKEGSPTSIRDGWRIWLENDPRLDSEDSRDVIGNRAKDITTLANISPIESDTT